MAELTINKLTDGNGNYITTLTKNDVTLRDPDDPNTIYPYDSLYYLGNGTYALYGVNFAERPLRLYINGISQLWRAIHYGGERELKYMVITNATLDAISKKIVNLANGVGAADAINKSQLDGLETSIGTNFFKKTKTGGSSVLQTIENDVSFEKFPTKTNPYSHPTGDNEFTTKAYVDSQVSQIQVSPFQESANKVRVIKGGYQETGKVYTSIENALAYFSTAGVHNQCMVLIEGTGVTDETILLNQTYLKDYAHITGAGKHIYLILGGSSANITKNCRISNVSIILGAGVITTDRVYNSIQFENCLIYAYKNLTLTNGKMNNCIVLQPPGKSFTANGSSEITNCIFNQAVNIKEITGFAGNNSVEVNTSYTLPTDPTLPV